MKKSIEITPNIEALFGTRDENLHVLEDGLNINIDLRADRIDLEGAARDVARAEQISRTLNTCESRDTLSIMAT